jgi:WD40 repeat protein
MKSFLILLILLATTLNAKTDAILKLDTKGHTALIRDIIVTKSGDIISASDDKTIRVWDSKTGREKRKILGQIGQGSEGKIFAIALSDDEKYLAVGGFLNNNGDKEWGNIRIYNYKTGKLLKVLKSHTDVVNDLSFKDKYLISGSSDESAKIWSTSNWKLLDTIEFHKNYVYAVKIIKKSNSLYAITAGYDNKIALYDIKKREIIKSHTLDYKLQYLATNPKKNHIAVCGKGRQIKIYDYNLNLIKTISSQTVPAGLAYKGDYLVSGSGSYPDNINTYKVSNDYSLHSSFKEHDNVTMAVAFLDTDTVVSAGGNNNEIYIWNKDTTKVVKKIAGVGNRVWSVGIDGDKVAWGNVFMTKTNEQTKFQKSINLTNFTVTATKVGNEKTFNRISTKNGNYTLSHSRGGDYGYGDAVLDIYKDGSKRDSIIRGSTDGYRHRCYGWYRDLIISGGSNGYLKIYNKSGQQVASLVGHTGEVWSIALDGDRLVSGGDDQTMMVWDLSQLRIESGELKYDEEFINRYMKKYDWSRQDVIQAAKEQGVNIYLDNSQKLYPMLNIFVSKNNEYIVWSKSGYFTSSVGGDKYVGYHINSGANKEARYVGSEKFFDTLYRPDIISAIVQTGSEKKAIAYASQTKKVQTVDITNWLPPIVTLLSDDKISTNKSSITIKYQIQSDSKITNTIITLNGKKLDTRALYIKKDKNNKTIKIELENGENLISIKAKNKYAYSDEVYINAYKKSKIKDIYKPTLYLLSIGVSKYKDSQYNLKFAHKDSNAIAKLFDNQKGKIYKDVKIKNLTNQNATSDNILDGLDWIDKEVTSKDVAIIFIAGHGINDEKGEYYFLSHEANLDRLRRTALPWYELQRTIDNLPSKTILLADTCHSGNISSTRRDVTGAIKSIINSGSGSVIMTATTGNGYSYEDNKWGHGAFTKSIIEGIKNLKADYDNDKIITIKEIDLYITNRVKKLTNGKQKPTTIIPQSVPDFAIGVK